MSQSSAPQEPRPGNNANSLENDLESQASTEATSVSGLSGAGVPVPLPQDPPEGGLRRFWRLIAHNKKVLIGVIILAVFVLIAIFGPFLVHGDPNAVTDAIAENPSATHLLGTTDEGQDVLSQLIVGTRASIFWGLFTGVLVTILSVVVGLVGGYAGGAIDEVFSLVSNVFLILPALPLAIIMAAYFPVKGDWTVAFVITITSWSWQARVLRAQTLTMRNRDFISAARTSGESGWRIVFYEILPNELALIVAGFIGTVIYVILAAAGLEFLGLGNSSSVSWGSMFYWAQNRGALVEGIWWWFLPPGISIALLGVALALINFGIDEISNPRLQVKQRRPKLLQAIIPSVKNVSAEQ